MAIPEVHPQPEWYRGAVNTIGPRACYDEGKRAAETLFCDYHRQNGVNVRIVRIFNTYGPRMHPYDGRVISNFIRQALCGEDITIFGDGSQTRSFCYRDDLVEGMIRMMAAADDFIGPVNLGNPGEFSIKELAEIVIELTGSKSQVVYQPLPVDDPTQRQPDITLATQRLGWTPHVSLRDGLAKTIAWFRSIELSRLPPADAELFEGEKAQRHRGGIEALCLCPFVPSLSEPHPHPTHQAADADAADVEIVVAGVDFEAIDDHADGGAAVEQSGVAQPAQVERGGKDPGFGGEEIGPVGPIEAEVGVGRGVEPVEAEARAELGVFALGEAEYEVPIAEPKVIAAPLGELLVEIVPLGIHAQPPRGAQQQTRRRSGPGGPSCRRIRR